jgi:hypothetical protein
LAANICEAALVVSLSIVAQTLPKRVALVGRVTSLN